MGKTPLSSSNSILSFRPLQAGYKTCGPLRDHNGQCFRNSLRYSANTPASSERMICYFHHWKLGSDQLYQREGPMADRVICHHLALPSLRKKKTFSIFHKFFENEYRLKGTSNYLPPPQTDKKRDALKTSLLTLVASYIPRWENKLPQ